jgi:hypothetical protein
MEESPGALLMSVVQTICSNDVAFSAIKASGEVVGWGHSVSIPVVEESDSLRIADSVYVGAELRPKLLHYKIDPKL